MKLIRTSAIAVTALAGLLSIAGPASAGDRAPAPKPTAPTSGIVLGSPVRPTHHSCHPGQTCPSDDNDDRLDNIISCFAYGGWPEDGEDGSISCYA